MSFNSTQKNYSKPVHPNIKPILFSNTYVFRSQKANPCIQLENVIELSMLLSILEKQKQHTCGSAGQVLLTALIRQCRRCAKSSTCEALQDMCCKQHICGSAGHVL